MSDNVEDGNLLKLQLCGSNFEFEQLFTGFFITQPKLYWSVYGTGQSYKVHSQHFSTEQNNHILETLYVSIKMSNFQVKKTYETAQGTALAHHPLHFLGLIKCFGLLPTLVLRYFGFRFKMKSNPIFTYTTALTLTQPLLVYKIF